MTLPNRVVTEDRRLEKQAESTSAELMRHRWHWTLEESNPERVSIREYARAIGRSEMTVREAVNAWQIMLDDAARGTPRTPDEARHRATMGAETQAATEAVAAARGIQFGTAARNRPTEVRRVREVARERAEQRGTTIDEETRKVAEWTVKAEKASQAQQEERKEKLGLRFIAMEGHLTKAKRALIDALNEAHSVPWGEEERELLSDTVANVKALLNLIDLAFAGTADVDWDAELAQLTEVDQ